MSDSPKDNVIQGRWHFGVPIYEKHLPGFANHRDEAIRHLQALKSSGEGIRRSNQGGWHSGDDLHLSKDPVIHDLMVSVLQVATACIKDFEGDRDYRDVRMVGAWVNVNGQGDWNAPHEHLPCHWSGVFYVDAGEPVTTDDPDSLEGQILFFDPLPLGREWKRPPNVAYKPVTGTMLLFPSFLTHMVAPYRGSKPRISVAFNLVVDR